MPPLAPSPSTPADIVVFGKIVEAYGLRGAVKVHPFVGDPQSWRGLKQWWIGADEKRPETWRALALSRCTQRGEVLIAELEGATDRNAAEALVGQLAGVPHADLPAAGDGEYYWVDLIGLEVVNTRDRPLGRVLGLIETPANDVLRVGDGEGEERLLPFVATVVLEVDLPARRIRVEWEEDW